MKHFLSTTLRFFAIITAFIVLVFVLRVGWVRSIDWQFAGDKHVIFIGASHIAKGIDDTLYEGSVNLGLASERYLFTYLKLQNVLAANPQIDTAFLEFAPTDMHKNTDSKYYSANEMGLFLPMYFPYFTREEWKLYAKIGLSRSGTLLLQKVVKDLPQNYRSFGRYRPSDIVFSPDKSKREDVKWLEKGTEINYRYLNKIITLCNDHGIKLYLLYMPMYDAENSYNQAYFYQAYKRNFSAVEFLDYSRLEIPDHYRENEDHLNRSGAQLFTNQLIHDMRGGEK